MMQNTYRILINKCAMLRIDKFTDSLSNLEVQKPSASKQNHGNSKPVMLDEITQNVELPGNVRERDQYDGPRM